MPSKNLDDLKKVAKKSGDDALLGAVKVMDEVEKAVRNQDDAIETINDNLDETKTELTKSVEDAKTSIQKGFDQVADKFAAMEKRQILTGRITAGRSGEDGLLDAIPDEKRGMAADAEAFPTLWNVSGRGPIHKAAVAHWFQTSAKLQVPRYSNQGRQLGEDLDKINTAFSDVYGKAARTPLTGTTATGGGAATPTIVANDILRLISDNSDIYRLCRQVPVTSDKIEWPNEATAMRVAWQETQGSAITTSEPTFGSNTITIHRLGGYGLASLEVLEDANVGILGYLQTALMEKIGAALDSETMQGTGSPYTGIRTASGVNVQNFGTGPTTAGGEANYANLVKLYVKAGQNSARRNAVFVMNHQLYGEVLSQVDSQGQPVVRLGQVEGAPADTLFGRPIIVSSNLTAGAAITTTGDVIATMYFGPPSALIWNIRRGIEWDVSEQFKFSTYQLAFRMVMRAGFLAGVPSAWAVAKDVHAD